MRTKLSALVLTALLAGPLAFAQGASKTTRPPHDAPPATTNGAEHGKTGHNKKPSESCREHGKKIKHGSKAPLSKEDEQLDQLLMGIYG